MLTTQSKHTILLPIELVAGEPATLAVIGRDGRVESGVQLVLSSGAVLKTDDSGRAHFLVPRQTGILFARILRDNAQAAADVIEASETDLKVSYAPSATPLQRPVAIFGSGFEGDADRNKVQFGEGKALVAAASPAELVLLPPPHQSPRIVDVSIQNGSAQASLQIAFIGVRVTLAKQDITPGKKNDLLLNVTGTERPMQFRVANLSPEILRFQRGATELVRTSGGTENVGKFEVRGLRSGNFAVQIELVPPSVAVAPSAARDLLEEAVKIAPPTEKPELAKIIRELDPRQADISGASRALERIVIAPEGGDFAALMRSARQALLGHE